MRSILAALANLGSTGAGVQQVARMLDSGRYDGSALPSLGTLFGGGAATQDARGAGKGILESLFGSKRFPGDSSLTISTSKRARRA